MRVLIGVPCSETIKTRTAFSLFNLGKQTPATLQMQLGADVAHNRNVLAQYTLDKGFTHLFFVDSDMSFAPDTLDRMLAHDKDILGLAANHRRLPLESVVKPLKQGEVNQPIPRELFEAASCGTGVMLIKTDVFNHLPQPWFHFDYEDERIGEDVRFCRLAREAGYSIFVDPTIPIRHVGEYLY